MSTSFWQKKWLVTFILFDLCLFKYFSLSQIFVITLHILWSEVKCIAKLSLWEIFWISNSLQRKFTYHSFIFFCRYVLLPRWLSLAGLLLSRRATRQFSIEKCWIRTCKVWRSHRLLWWKTTHYSLPSTTKRRKQKWNSLKWLPYFCE